MAYDNSGGGMASMEDDPYSDAGMAGGDADSGKDMPKDEKGEAEGDSVEAVLPKTILAGKHFDVGDEVVLKITAMHDDEISVKYAPAKKDDGDEDGKEDAMTEKAEMPSKEPDGGDMGSEYD